MVGLRFTDYYQERLKAAAHQAAQGLHSHLCLTRWIDGIRQSTVIGRGPMIYILVFAIVGELATLFFLTPVYGFAVAFLAAPVGGASLALITGLYLNVTGRRGSSNSQRRVSDHSASNTPAA